MGAKKIIVAVVLVLMVLAIGGGVVWYVSVPHTPEAQYAYAEKLEKKLRADALTQSPEQLKGEIGDVQDQYKRVGTRFGASAKAAEGLKQIVKIDEEVAKDRTRARADLDEIIKQYPDEENAGFALLEQAKLIRAEGDELKTGKPDEAVGKYKEAIAKLTEYRTKFATGKRADDALMEIGRIWQDGIGDPPIAAIETFQQVLKDYPQSDYKPEAMYRLAKLFEKIHEYGQALQLYTQLQEEFPKYRADEVTFARAKILDEQMKKHDEAAKEFERIQKEFPDSPLSGQAGSQARKAKGEAAATEGEQYGKGRYGGQIPYDTVRDKPLPPAGMFRQFAEQKLDAQKYDMTVTFDPPMHRISVVGTLSLVNRGADKNEMLLMLGDGMEFNSLKVDGVEVKYVQKGQTLKISLPAELKKDAATTVAFDYSGQYAPPMPGPGGVDNKEKLTTPMPAPMDAPQAVAPTTEPQVVKLHMDPQMGLGEFGYGLSGAAWYPVTIIGDVFDAHVVIKTPANVEAVMTGEMVKREKSTEPGKPGVFEFQTKSPVFGLYFAYGPYEMREEQVGAIHYYTYFRPENASKTDAYIDVTNRILSFYASKYVPFPYEKMAMVETPLPPFLGGVGPASLMFLHEKMVAHKDVPENLLAHELAHQWFGNLVPINMADPGYNQWLSEGFATYSDALYTEHTDGEAAFVKHMERYSQLFFQFEMMAPRGEGSIRDTFPDSPLYRPVIYEKGAIVLNMLRKLMGDEKFFGMMKEYVETYKNKPTTVDDFRRLASKVYGQDLSWFFAQWIDQNVFAHWVVTAEVTEKSGAGSQKSEGAGTQPAAGDFAVKLTVDQPDDLVKMPVDITLLGDGGKRQVVPNVMLDQKEQTVDLTMPFKPVKVILDEDYWVLHRPGSDNIWPSEKVAAH
ncbi:MAG TPA: M1 family aminopeptidase [Phycisphaerae bacterium]|nr:M1 family aminopeptidase [Phycisphaerae bacterium]